MSSSSSATPPDTIMLSDPTADIGDAVNRIDVPAGGNSSVPKTKRLACMICRKRKLKCDGIKPSCSTCSRLGHACQYDEVRRKSGPKRGYVKALEERLKQVETMLKSQEVTSTSPDGSKAMPTSVDSGSKQQRPMNQRAAATANFNVTDPSIGIASSRDMDRWPFNPESPNRVDEFNFNSNMMGMSAVDGNFTWEMIGLGLEEPLPPQETIDELHQIYFEKIHPSVPMIHKYRYLAAMNLAPAQRPPVCLRYAMWTLACSVTEKYQNLKDLFYQRARKYVEADYIKGYGEHMISVAHAQTHVLLSSYEFKWMYFPRAWMSTGSAVRLCQMIGLHRLDGAGLDVKQCLPPARDWTEREERRRTFWMVFCQDRYASIGTGWPMTIDEKDILTNLPSSDEAFEHSRPEQTPSLANAMSPQGAGKLTAFGGIVLLACLFGRNLVHLHRPDADERDHDLNGDFWKRHRQLDNILLNTSLCLPSQLKLPNGLTNPNIVFMNMCIHTSTICLHQAAIFKADKNRLPNSVSSESKVRCITSANEIASIMRMISHLDLSAMNPFISFCLYVSARVFVQYLKSRPDDSQTADSLRFLLAAMSALKKRNPLTESFLVQLDVDLEALGVRIPKLKSAFPRSTDSPGPSRNPHSSQLNRVREEATRNGVPYTNECHFLKGMGDDGNPANAPDIVEADPPNPNISGFPATEPANLPTRERVQAPYLPAQGLMPHSYPEYGAPEIDPGNNDMSATPPSGGQSSRPTPNSSTASETLSNLTPGGNTFETTSSPTSLKNLMNMPGTTTQGEMGANNAGFNFNDPPFVLGSGVSEYPVPSGWGGAGDMSVQAGMTPGTERMLQSMMAGSIDAMDMGWDPNT
ncbi:uncharacterized protein QC761_113830 [Podospora bellae-mahoneyi]|uniref:Zn(2)-C6 fungal-type domain-containing protein n=1 Tax=Podospora bellae-mahoneyi TaxID=2093777 RepID=A0ABR0FZ94_9PEZI|nr:hypothetical protein QC761_113830 [Podospora bellae-mahoneyi]